MKNSRKSDKEISRRQLLTGTAAAAFTIVPRQVLGGSGHAPPSDKLNIAAVGVGGMGKNNLEALAGENIVALCDVDESFAAGTFQLYPAAGRFKDFREMLEKQKDIEAVVVATPDHTHAAVAMMAMKMGKHVYIQKPLTHTVYEARLLTETARETKVATQMGNQGRSGEGVRLVCEWIWDGAIGPVREVHAWTERPTWMQGIGRPPGEDPIPPGLDWDLWLGPAPYRPYIGFRYPFGRPEVKQYRGAYHPHDWRGYWDFGGGAIADMFCHIVDAAFWSLKLKYPTSVEGYPANYLDGMLGKPDIMDTYPPASIIYYEFPARGDMPPVRLTWYDGGLKPPRPTELEAEREVGRGMSLIFVGDKGALVCGETGESPRLIPESKMKAYKRPPRTLPRIGEGEKAGKRGHEMDWVRACKEGKAACSNFNESGPLTEAALLGNVAIRMPGVKLQWDGVNIKFTNSPQANQYLHKEYRKGWSLLLVLALLLGISSGSWAHAGQQKPAPANQEQDMSGREGWLLAMQSYSFRNFTFFEGLEKTAALALKYTEGSSGRIVSNSRPGFKFSDMLEASNEALAVRKEVKTKLHELGMKMLSYGVVELPNDETRCRKVFDFAQDMGIETIISEPPLEALDLIDKLCGQYRIKVAIHNHAAPSPYWHPDLLLKAFRGRSRMIGACADTGHWMRSGLNPVKMLQKLQDRIISVHLKDRTDYGRLDTHDVPWGTGKGQIKEVLAELDRQNFQGLLTIEYEYNWDNSIPDIRQSIDYFKKVSGELARSRTREVYGR